MRGVFAVGVMWLVAACTSDELVFGQGSTTEGSGAGSTATSAAGSGGGTTSSASGSSGSSGSAGAGGAPSGGSGTASGTGGAGGSIDYDPYGACDTSGNCPGNQTCVDGSPTPTSNVCAPPCMVDSDCPPPPGGTVTPRCYSPGPSCFLWGCGTAMCPPGMSCGGVYCVWGL